MNDNIQGQNRRMMTIHPVAAAAAGRQTAAAKKTAAFADRS